jgi:hypothetical protein
LELVLIIDQVIRLNKILSTSISSAAGSYFALQSVLKKSLQIHSIFYEKLVICEKMNTEPSESSNKINSLPFFGSLTPHESTRVDNGLGMLIGGLLAGGASGMLTHAREEYQHKQMYGHMNTIEQTASKSKLLHLVSRNGLKYGGFVAAFIGCELSIARARGKEDYWNVCAAGAVTGGAFCARGGPAAAIAGTIMGCSLAYVTSAGLNILQDIEKIMIKREEKVKEEAYMRSMMPEPENNDTTVKHISRLQKVLAEWPSETKK